MVFDPSERKHNVPNKPGLRRVAVGHPWTLDAFLQTGDPPVTAEQVKNAPKNPPRALLRPSDYRPLPGAGQPKKTPTKKKGGGR